MSSGEISNCTIVAPGSVGKMLREAQRESVLTEYLSLRSSARPRARAESETCTAETKALVDICNYFYDLGFTNDELRRGMTKGCFELLKEKANG